MRYGRNGVPVGQTNPAPTLSTEPVAVAVVPDPPSAIAGVKGATYPIVVGAEGEGTGPIVVETTEYTDPVTVAVFEHEGQEYEVGCDLRVYRYTKGLVEAVVPADPIGVPMPEVFEIDVAKVPPLGQLRHLLTKFFGKYNREVLMVYGKVRGRKEWAYVVPEQEGTLGSVDWDDKKAVLRLYEMAEWVGTIHVHPSNGVQPSSTDLDTWKKPENAGLHFILGRQGAVSLWVSVKGHAFEWWTGELPVEAVKVRWENSEKRRLCDLLKEPKRSCLFGLGYFGEPGSSRPGRRSDLGRPGLYSPYRTPFDWEEKATYNFTSEACEDCGLVYGSRNTACPHCGRDKTIPVVAGGSPAHVLAGPIRTSPDEKVRDAEYWKRQLWESELTDVGGMVVPKDMVCIFYDGLELLVPTEKAIQFGKLLEFGRIESIVEVDLDYGDDAFENLEELARQCDQELLQDARQDLGGGD